MYFLKLKLTLIFIKKCQNAIFIVENLMSFQNPHSGYYGIGASFGSQSPKMAASEHAS